MKIVIGLGIGFLLGFALMFWIAVAMVDKVKDNENAKHQALLNQLSDAAAPWMDCVNDILDAVQSGKLHNKSVRDQVLMIKEVIKAARE